MLGLDRILWPLSAVGASDTSARESAFRPPRVSGAQHAGDGRSAGVGHAECEYHGRCCCPRSTSLRPQRFASMGSPEAIRFGLD